MSFESVLLAAQRRRDAEVRGEIDIALASAAGKPGTNFTQVSPQARAKLHGILEHYRNKPHPFAACVRDNRKRFGPDAERVCAVVKDLIMNTTKWRKGGHKKLSELNEEEFDAEVGEYLMSLAPEEIEALAEALSGDE